jgi:hypothetical protein
MPPTCIEIYPSAHPDGFTDAEVTEAAELLRTAGTLHGWMERPPGAPAPTPERPVSARPWRTRTETSQRGPAGRTRRPGQ